MIFFLLFLRLLIAFLIHHIQGYDLIGAFFLSFLLEFNFLIHHDSIDPLFRFEVFNCGISVDSPALFDTDWTHRRRQGLDRVRMTNRNNFLVRMSQFDQRVHLVHIFPMLHLFFKPFLSLFFSHFHLSHIFIYNLIFKS